MAISKGRIEITTLEAWKRLAPPARPNQWVDGRSAQEVARAWLEGNGTHLPPEVASVLAAHPNFGKVQAWEAEPEVKLHFDKYTGNTRNSDLVVHAQDKHGRFLMAIEAKADESFGLSVRKTLVDAENKLQNKIKTNVVERVQQLLQALLGHKELTAGSVESPDYDLRYQLLTACAGALCEAERHGYSRTLMLVHEFVTNKTTDKKHQRNADDLNRFSVRLSQGMITEIPFGEICGPFVVPGTPMLTTQIPLYIGKVSRNLRPIRT